MRFKTVLIAVVLILVLSLWALAIALTTAMNEEWNESPLLAEAHNEGGES